MSAQAKPIKEPVVRRLLGDEPCERIDAAELRPSAVRTTLPRPSELPGGKPTPHRAIVCRLYPTSENARTKFRRAGAVFAEAIVFPDPDDDLELNLLEGFHSAMILANDVLGIAELGSGEQ